MAVNPSGGSGVFTNQWFPAYAMLPWSFGHRNSNLRECDMQKVDWLPAGNDTKEVLAAAYNEFFRKAQIAVIASEFPLSTPYEPPAPTVNAFGTLVIRQVTPVQAKAIHNAIHSARRASSWRPGGMSYGWPSLHSFRIYLATRESEAGQSVMFPILYDDSSDIDAILEYAKNPIHQAAFQSLGLSESQMTVTTYAYKEKVGWSVRG